MTLFYIKTDLDVAGPFTGIEIREASLAGIVRPETYLAGTEAGPWIPAKQAGLFSEKGTALPHPPGTSIPLFQTRGMPGAFMGPFKLRELIGFACQGMLPPSAELQSDPTRPWIAITGTGILPACLRGDLVRIKDDGKLVLRTVIPADLDQRRIDLQSLSSPIQRAAQVIASGATAMPSKTKTTTPIAAPPSNERIDEVAALDASDDENECDESHESSGPSKVLTRARQGIGSSLDVLCRPAVAAAVLFVAACSIGLPVAYSAWSRTAMPRQEILGAWSNSSRVDQTRVGGESDTNVSMSDTVFGIAFRSDNSCVLANSRGRSWTGDFRWMTRTDHDSGFRPDDEVAIRYDSAQPNHVEDAVRASDGYLRLEGLVTELPLLDQHPVRDLFVRRDGDRLRVGYLTSARFVEGRKQLTAAWINVTAAANQSNSILNRLRSIKETRHVQPTFDQSKPLAIAIDAAIQGNKFEYRGREVFRYGSFAHSSVVDAAFLLKQFGVPIDARPLYEFEKQPSYNGPTMDDANLLNYGSIEFIVDPAGQLLFVSIDPSTITDRP